jgi:hypothetical protein
MRIGNRVLVDAAVDEGCHHRLHGFQSIFQSIFRNIRIRLELAGVDEEPPEAPVSAPLVHSREDLPALSCDEQNTSSSVQLLIRCENKNKVTSQSHGHSSLCSKHDVILIAHTMIKINLPRPRR